MGASLYDAPVFEDHDGVAVADGGQPVGDDEYGAPFHEVIHALLYDLLCPCIYGGRGLIQDQHLLICDGLSGYGEELSIPLGELFPFAA